MELFSLFPVRSCPFFLCTPVQGTSVQTHSTSCSWNLRPFILTPCKVALFFHTRAAKGSLLFSGVSLHQPHEDHPPCTPMRFDIIFFSCSRITIYMRQRPGGVDRCQSARVPVDTISPVCGTSTTPSLASTRIVAHQVHARV